MPTLAHEIISFLNKKYPTRDSASIQHIAGHDFSENIQIIPQFILDLTYPTPESHSLNIDHYRYKMTQRLPTLSHSLDTYGWAYSLDERDAMIETLITLGKEFNVALDVDKMLSNIDRLIKSHYFIVITIIEVRILQAKS